MSQRNAVVGKTLLFIAQSQPDNHVHHNPQLTSLHFSPPTCVLAQSMSTGSRIVDMSNEDYCIILMLLVEEKYGQGYRNSSVAASNSGGRS